MQQGVTLSVRLAPKLQGIRSLAKRHAAGVAIAAVLALPSLYLLANVPPLWRDVDAYVQVTKKPGASTILGHGLLYCFAARVPLFAGYELERLRGSAAPLARNFFVEPELTDSGVYLLVALQHLALVAAGIYFISGLAKTFALRVTFAALWAATPLFYTFAHCVGSETLSLILTVCAAGAGLRIVRGEQPLDWKRWVIFGVFCWLAILARHVNHLLVVVLPLAFLFAAALTALMRSFRLVTADQRELRAGALLRNAVLATVAAIAVLAAANLSTRFFAKLGGQDYRPKIGYTFLWRLHFLEALSAEDRASVLDQAARGAKSPEAQKLIALLAAAYGGEAPLRASDFARNARGALFPGDKRASYKLDLALNDMTGAFLNPPHPFYVAAVREDLLRARRTPLAAIPATLFNTTTYFFDHPETMPKCAPLVTFRNHTAEEIRGIPLRTAYFAIGNGLAYEIALSIWAVLLGATLILARKQPEPIAPIGAYAIALTSVGAVMMTSAALFGEYLPRYTLPMWLLLLLSSFIIIAELLKGALSARASSGETVRSAIHDSTS